MDEWEFTPEEEAALRRAKEQAARGELISQEELDDLFLQDDLDRRERLLLEKKELRCA